MKYCFCGKEEQQSSFQPTTWNSVEELCDNITLIDRAKTILEGSVNEIRSTWAANEYDLVFDGEVKIEE